MYSSKKIVSELSKRAMNKKLRAKGYTEQRNSRLHKSVTSYWKPNDISDRVMVVFKKYIGKPQANAI